MTQTTIAPQQGKQEVFLSTPADIAIYGGAAGAGKTFALLLEPLRHMANKDFGAVIFRRTRPQITLKGGLLDESTKLYPLLGYTLTRPDGNFTWTAGNGATITLDAIQYDASRFDWQGSQIPLLCYDELTHFSSTIFWYLLSRNRSTCGVRPYIRATCNPDPDSWVAEFISWWIDQDTGYPIQERSGVLRWFVRVNDALFWYDSFDEANANKPDPDATPKSATFISASIYDNPALLQADPGYLGNLKALPYVEMERLFGGNWKVRPSAGKVFNRAWFEIVDAIPAGGTSCRAWDFAGTEKQLKGNDPDFTAGVLIRKVNGVYYICDVLDVQEGPAMVETMFKNTANQDKRLLENLGTTYKVRFEHEPGSAAIRDSWRLVTLLDGFDVMGTLASGDKLTRSRALAAQAKAGNVKLLRGAWNETWLKHMHNIPDGTHDDIHDASALGYNSLATQQELETAGGIW